MRGAAVLLFACACSAPQFIVHVDTDAPVPPRPGAAPDPARPPWLFDQLRIELLHGDQPAAAANTRRDFAIDEGLFLDRRVSFGVAPPFDQRGYVVRVRLFRGDHALHGEPSPTATLETNLTLPALAATAGAIDLVVHLHVADIGQPQALAATEGTVSRSQVSSWPGARVVPCRGTAAADEACVPGGAYWMGDPLLGDLGDEIDADRERLVVLSPFFIGTHEVTVAEFRAGPTALDPPLQPVFWPGETDPSVFDNWCSYTPRADASDPGDTHARLSLSCIAWSGANAYCEQLGRHLPSEAQFEFLASGRGAERAYIWGDDVPNCDDAVFGWGGLAFTQNYDQECRTSPALVAARPPGQGQRDRITLTNGAGEPRDVLDLAGNLNEWTRDHWSRQDEAYWSRPGVFTDPVADLISPADGDQGVGRGGNFYDPPLLLRAGARQRLVTDRDTVYFYVGFRCVRSAM